MSKLNGKANGTRTQGSRKPDFNRHARKCLICSHEQCEDIENAFISWHSPEAIAAEYGLRDRAAIYGHASAAGLFERRQRNVRAALEKLIEKAGGQIEIDGGRTRMSAIPYADPGEQAHGCGFPANWMWLRERRQTILTQSHDSGRGSALTV